MTPDEGNNKVVPRRGEEILKTFEESEIKTVLREWLADQFSPEKSREDRRLNNSEEMQRLRGSWRSFIPLGAAALFEVLLIFLFGSLGAYLSAFILLALIILYSFQALADARRGMSNRIRQNRSRSLRLKQEALALLDLLPAEEKDHAEVSRSLNELEGEVKYLNSLDKTSLGFLGRVFTLGPPTLIALGYILQLTGSMDMKAFVEGNPTIGPAFGYAVAAGVVISLVNEFVITLRTIRTERVVQIISLAKALHAEKQAT